MSTGWFAVLAVVLAVAGTTWALSRRPRFGRIAGGIAIALVGAWIAIAVLVSLDHHDADGFIDCHPSCSGWQRTVQVVTWGAPVVLAALGLGVLAGRSTRRRTR